MVVRQGRSIGAVFRPELGTDERLHRLFLDGLITAPEAVPAVAVELRDELDLHEYAPDETRRVVEAYLEACEDAQFTRVRIIHGKGKGVRRRIVQSILSAHPAVLSWRPAAEDGGGWGATVVVLRR
ncbi:Smr/MutS family protein [bacterium]|nr:Smr/MutS family protein [candidate division CSSED10-310 bacterium]